jgi:hypothetical protein
MLIFFLVVIDAILAELNHQFSEISSDLLVYSAAFNPKNSFADFELGKVPEIMVKTDMHNSYKLVYQFIELTLILPVATTSVERIFSNMSIIKANLRSKMGDEWLND